MTHTYLTLPAAGFVYGSALSDSLSRPLKTKHIEPLKGEITSLAKIQDLGKGLDVFNVKRIGMQVEIKCCKSCL